MKQDLLNIIYYWQRTMPNSTALNVDERSYTYKQLWDASVNLSKQLQSRQIKGNLIGIVAKRSDFAVIAMLSVMQVGKRFVHINNRTEYNKLKIILNNSNISTLITDDKNLFEVCEHNCIFINEINQNENGNNYFDFSLPFTDEVGSFLSSGSTGLPTIYNRTNSSLFTEAMLWIFELQLNKKTKFYVSNSLAYIGSFVLLYSVLYSGGTVYMNDGKEIIEVLNSDKSYDYMFLMPHDIRKLLSNSPKSFISKTSNLLTMGAPISLLEKKEIGKVLNCRVVEMWGNSEGLATLIFSDDVKYNTGSIGRATYTDILYIADEFGNRKKPFEIGFLAGKSDNDTDKSQELTISDDYGYMDEEGYFFLIGRKNNIILFPDNVYFSATELEHYICEKCNISKCVVVTEKDTCEVYAFYVDGVQKEIEECIKEYLLNYQEKVVLGNVQRLPEIPTTENGKTKYSELCKLI